MTSLSTNYPSDKEMEREQRLADEHMALDGNWEWGERLLETPEASERPSERYGERYSEQLSEQTKTMTW